MPTETEVLRSALLELADASENLRGFEAMEEASEDETASAEIFDRYLQAVQRARELGRA